MDTTSQQRLLGYFIEEAKEHLETLEKGILELGAVMQDTERVNELFRAAHSIKGGAAMLGYNSIQKVAHRLEDAFKILKENSIEVDQRLESLFLRGYDVLQDLVERLESAMELPDNEVAGIMQDAEPYFAELQDYLKQALGGGAKQAAPAPAAAPAPVDITEEVKNLLRQMLQLFKQRSTPENRQKLQQICGDLGKLAPQEQNWQTLTEKAARAISNPKHPYKILAPVIIKELKQGSDYLVLGKGNLVVPSQNLEKLAGASSPQILITVEPQQAAKAIIQAFNKQQLSQLIQLLQAGS
ncbi:MAG: Hpt domain-containing protein [Prochloraceae cyanobacterium]|nr:Hpt domain-containing protein [Prochloraceae cyanobacterium]